jgi:hypothetical protein
MASPTLLGLPLEIRFEIYDYLLVLSPLPNFADHSYLSRPAVHTAILETCRPTNYEATPILYRDNTFRLERVSAKCPDTNGSGVRISLRTHMKAVPFDVVHKYGIRNFLLQWSLNTHPFCMEQYQFSKECVRKALSGARSVTLNILVAGVLDAGCTSALEALEGVRDVEHVDIRGAAEEIKEYTDGLRTLMMGSGPVETSSEVDALAIANKTTTIPLAVTSCLKAAAQQNRDSLTRNGRMEVLA